MATKKFLLEVEEGMTKCDWCPLQTTMGNCCGGIGELDCSTYNFDTMKITEYNEGEALLYAVTKTAERTKREMIEKAAKWLYIYYPTLERSKSFEDAWKHFKRAMEE